MFNPAITAALGAGATVVTPNNRLARALADRYDAAQAQAGRNVWPTPRVLPWSAWLAALWLDGLAAEAFRHPRTLLNATQATRLWERAIDADQLPLLDASGAANRAAAAWNTFHAYATAGEDVRQFVHHGDDANAFVRWSAHFDGACTAISAIDHARLADWLVDALSRRPFTGGRSVALAGFVDLTPQQSRLVDAMRKTGANVEVAQSTTDPRGPRTRSQYLTPADELAAALQWARARTLADPAATATIAVLDLSSRLDATARLANEILSPAALREARAGAARPYNLSLAAPLVEHPLVASAFDLLQIAERRIPLSRACALLRSPFLAGGSAAAAHRARAEREWRKQNLLDIPLNTMIAALGVDDPLRDGLEALATGLAQRPQAAPMAWADAISDALARCGWPGGDAQGSELFQAHDAFRRAIGEWRTLGVVESRMTLAAAVASLHAVCLRTAFQPQSAPARIQILGVLEAAGLAFDGVWLAGMDADAWPPPVAPEAFLPVAWQRARGVPHASPEGSLERARRLTDQLASAAEAVIASHVMTTESTPRSASPLTAWDVAAHAPVPTPTMAEIAAAPELQRIDDAILPALATGTEVGGGARVVELQSDCPFRAAAALRLDANAWERPAIGLTPFERGKLVHAAMDAFWSRVRDHATLVAMDDTALRAAIADAVEMARTCLPSARWRALPQVVAGIESARLAALVLDFVQRHELPRPPFAVVHREYPVAIDLGGVRLNFRIDRVDALEDGAAVIDYKTGSLTPVSQWLQSRPVATQPGLYALALERRDPPVPVCAAALAGVRAGEPGMRGIAAGGSEWEGVDDAAQASRGALADFAAVKTWWHARFDALADDFRRGEAAVLPRAYPDPCGHCDFKPLCRIDLRAGAEQGATGGAEDDT